MTALIVPRTFGGTLILNIAAPVVQAIPSNVLHTRDGKATALRSRSSTTSTLKTRDS